MLTLENLQEFTKKFQTNEKNVVREYVQHLCLSNLYKIKEAQNLLFKGGTALKLIYQSPRFSEDLDFTGYFSRYKEIDELFLTTLTEIERIGITISFKEAKPTTGGYFGIINYRVFNFAEDMKFEVSLRKTRRNRAELTTIINDFTPSYALVHLSPKEMVSEKIQALINRRKPRDYWDLYFLLRHPLLNKFVDKKSLNIVMNRLNKDATDFRRELSVLLPISHHMILKNLTKLLKKEINQYLPR